MSLWLGQLGNHASRIDIKLDFLTFNFFFNQEFNREGKRRCRKDRRVYVKSEAERAEEAGKR